MASILQPTTGKQVENMNLSRHRDSLVFLHPTGNRNSRAAIEAFHRIGTLQYVYTSLAYPWSKGPPAKRKFPTDYWRIRQQPIRELLRLATARFPTFGIHDHETGFCSIDQIYRAIDRKAAAELRTHHAVNTVYAYEDGALETFKRAKALGGISTVYELPIAYWETSRRLLREEAERYPEWEPTLIGTQDSESKLARKTEELQLADAVVSPSQFVKSSIPRPLQSGKKLGIIPYGIDLDEITPKIEVNSSPKLRLLFVGLLTQRKGLADLFAAIRQLSPVSKRHIELRLIGRCPLPLEFFQNQEVEFQYLGICGRKEILQEMKLSDLLVLPSIVEGRALVQLEAISQGLPLLITENTGGDDLIIESETGFKVPIRSPEKIAEKIVWMLDHRSQIPEMKKSAIDLVEKKSWKHFQDELITFLYES